MWLKKRITIDVFKLFDTILANLSCIDVEYLGWFEYIWGLQTKTSSIPNNSTTYCSWKPNPWHQGGDTTASHLNTPRGHHLTRSKTPSWQSEWFLSFVFIENNDSFKTIGCKESIRSSSEKEYRNIEIVRERENIWKFENIFLTLKADEISSTARRSERGKTTDICELLYVDSKRTKIRYYW